MSTVWTKLFGNAPIAANDGPRRDVPAVTPAPAALRAESQRTTPTLALPKAPDAPHPFDDSFDLIGQRNETLRNQLDGIAEYFRDIENIRTQFEGVISPIARLLRDLEEARSSLEDSRQRHGALVVAHDDLLRDHGVASNERDSLSDERDSLSNDNRHLQFTLRETESTLAETQITANESSLKIGNLERSLENATLNARGLDEANAALRTTLDAREKLLTDAQQRRASISHQFELAQEEARALRRQLDEQSHETAKMARLHADVDTQRNEIARKASELEGQLAIESGAHAKVRAQRQDENEAHRVQAAGLAGELSAARARAEAAERLLTEARQEQRDKLQEMRVAERRALDVEANAQNQNKKQAELARELAAVNQRLSDVEASRTVLIERSSGLAKAAKAKENAMHRAEEKISLLETRLAETTKTAQAHRSQLEAKIAQLGEQAQSESAARAYAEGALQSARRERLNMQRELVARKIARAGEGEVAENAMESSTIQVSEPEADNVVVRIAS